MSGTGTEIVFIRLRGKASPLRLKGVVVEISRALYACDLKCYNIDFDVELLHWLIFHIRNNHHIHNVQAHIHHTDSKDQPLDLLQQRALLRQTSFFHNIHIRHTQGIHARHIRHIHNVQAHIHHKDQPQPLDLLQQRAQLRQTSSSFHNIHIHHTQGIHTQQIRHIHNVQAHIHHTDSKDQPHPLDLLQQRALLRQTSSSFHHIHNVQAHIHHKDSKDQPQPLDLLQQRALLRQTSSSFHNVHIHHTQGIHTQHIRHIHNVQAHILHTDSRDQPQHLDLLQQRALLQQT